MLLYRVFPYLPSAAPGQPGHPLYIHPRQGVSRWDNPHLYLVLYLATTPEGAIGEALGNLTVWTPAMLVFPGVPGSARMLGVYRIDETAHPLLDLDDAKELVGRSLRPTHVVIRNRPRTQQIAADIYNETKWAGIQWWSFHTPQWVVTALWDTADLVFDHVEDLAGNVALDDAASALAKARSGI